MASTAQAKALRHGVFLAPVYENDAFIGCAELVYEADRLVSLTMKETIDRSENACRSATPSASVDPRFDRDPQPVAHLVKTDEHNRYYHVEEKDGRYWFVAVHSKTGKLTVIGESPRDKG